jgi:hypothetical protein
MNNNIVEIVTVIIILLLLVFITRILGAGVARAKGIDAVKMFVKTEPYNLPPGNYYKLMLYNMDELVFKRFWCFGKYAAIRGEYFHILKPYADSV